MAVLNPLTTKEFVYISACCQSELPTNLERPEREADIKLGNDGGALDANSAARADGRTR